MNNENQSKYEILQPHRRTDGSYKSIEVLEMEYIERTDKLIHKMTDGVDLSSLSGERIHDRPTVAIFLDKSARPVAWLTRDLWDTLAPEPGSDEIPRQPDFKFLNIDRKRLQKKLDPNNTGGFTASGIDEKYINGLRSIFNEKHDGSFDAPNMLDDQRIMIVDEMYSTGATMDMATTLIKRAFPTSHVAGAHWMGSTTIVKGGSGNADAPVWYNDKIETGRGVGDTTHDEKKITVDPAQLFLSRRFPTPDKKALILREDFKTLAASVGESALYIAQHRSEDSAEIRSQHINNISYLESMLARRALLDQYKDTSRR